MKESLSALLDGECGDQELEQLLAEMERDPALREQFSRQFLTREARLGARIRTPDYGFSTRVLAAVRNESPGVLPVTARVRRLPWRAAAGLAAAAAVGAVAVLVAGPQARPGAVAGAAAPESPVAMTQPVSSDPVGEIDALDDDYERQLRNYMMAYSRSRGDQSVRSMLGYARYAAYDGADTAAPQTTESKP